MQRTIGTETEAVLAQRDVAGIVAVEIFTQDFFGAFADAIAQGVADADAFTRDPKGHGQASLVRESEPTLSRFDRRAIRPAQCRGSGRMTQRERRVHYQACSVCRGDAAPMKVSASLRDISRRCGGRYQSRSRAIVPR